MIQMSYSKQHHGLLAIVLTSVLALSGCSDNPGLRLRYEAEKRFYKVEKELTDAVVAPGDELSSSERRDFSRQFRDVLAFCYAALDSVDVEAYPVEHREIEYKAFQAATRVAQQNFTARRFDTAAAIMTELIERTNLQGAPRLEAYLNLGQALQAAGSWDSAIAVYDYSIESFYPPTDQNGDVIPRLFNLPAHMYRIARTIGDTANIDRFYERATNYYGEIIDRFANTRLEPQAHINMAAIATDRNNPRVAIDHLLAVNDTTLQQRLRIGMQTAQLFAGGLQQYDSARVIYENLQKQLDPGDADERRIMAHLEYLLASILLQQGESEEARRRLVELKRDQPNYWANSPEAQLTMARTWDADNNWSRAEVEYTYLIDRYSASQEAMAAYLYLIQKNRELDRPQVAEEWVERAAQAYRQLAVRGAGGPIEARALFFQARLQESEGQLEAAAASLEELFSKFPNTEAGRQALLRSAAIYGQRLGRPEVADSLINRLRASLTQIDPAWQND